MLIGPRQYWGAFAWLGAPLAGGQARWPSYQRGGRILSLRPGGATVAITDAAYEGEHACDLWSALG